MDPQVKATADIFLIDFCIFLCYVLLFFAIRGTRGDKDVVLPNWKGQKALNEARFTTRDLRPSIVTDELMEELAPQFE